MTYRGKLLHFLSSPLSSPLTCDCPTLLGVPSPELRGDAVGVLPGVLPGVLDADVGAAFPPAGRKPVAEMDTTSKNCFYWEKQEHTL